MAITATLGGVTIRGAMINGSELNFARQNRWASAEPLGYTGRINTLVGVRPIVHTYHAMLTTSQKNSIKTLADAAAAVAFVYTTTDIAISMTVLITEFSARKTRNTGDHGYWDCLMLLEEQP